MSERVDDGGRLGFSDAVVAGIPINNRRQSVSPWDKSGKKAMGGFQERGEGAQNSTYEYD